MYEIINRHTRRVVEIVRTRLEASRRVAQLNWEYGLLAYAYRHIP